MGREAIQPLLLRYPELYRGFVELLRTRLRGSHELSRALAHDKVESRVASLLITLVLKTPQNPELNISRTELAELCGITIETASRVMKGFESEQLIEMDRSGTVRVLRLDALRSLTGVE